MVFWWIMFICGLLVPAAMIIAGRLMWKHCPKEINNWIGYRTKRSMKSEEAWKFAHEYCGKLWWILGWAAALPLGLVIIPFIVSSDLIIGIVGATAVGVQVILLTATIIPTEIALKKNFNDDGTRR